MRGAGKIATRAYDEFYDAVHYGMRMRVVECQHARGFVARA